MSGHQHAELEDTVYFWFGSNDTAGSGDDGASPLFDVREAGAAAGAIPLLSGTPTLLTHANYPAGCYEIAVAATAGNGFAANDTFAVFCTLAVDSQNPTGYVGSCTLTPLLNAIDTYTLPGQVAPPLAPTFIEMLTHLYKVYRNKTTQTATTFSVFADNESTVDQKATTSIAAGTATKGEIGSGP